MSIRRPRWPPSGRGPPGSQPVTARLTDAGWEKLVVEGAHCGPSARQAAWSPSSTLGLTEVFDHVYGTSAGAMNASYFVSGQLRGSGSASLLRGHEPSRGGEPLAVLEDPRSRPALRPDGPERQAAASRHPLGRALEAPHRDAGGQDGHGRLFDAQDVLAARPRCCRRCGRRPPRRSSTTTPSPSRRPPSSTRASSTSVSDRRRAGAPDAPTSWCC